MTLRKTPSAWSHEGANWQMRFAFIASKQAAFRVSAMCRVPRVSPRVSEKRTAIVSMTTSMSGTEAAAGPIIRRDRRRRPPPVSTPAGQ